MYSYWHIVAALLAVASYFALPYFEPLIFPFPRAVSSRIDTLTSVSTLDSAALSSAKQIGRAELFESKRITLNLMGDDPDVTEFKLDLFSVAYAHVRQVFVKIDAATCPGALLPLFPIARLLDTVHLDVVPLVWSEEKRDFVASCGHTLLPRVLAALANNNRLVELHLSGIGSADGASSLSAALASLLTHQPRLQVLSLHADRNDPPALSLDTMHPPPVYFYLSQPLPALQNLVDLSLRGAVLAPDTLQLFRPLLHHWRLRRLDIADCWLGDLSTGHPRGTTTLRSYEAAVALLAQALSGLQRLQTLDVSRLKGSSPGVAGSPLRTFATTSLQHLVALRELYARGLGEPAAALESLLASAVRLPYLRLLDISGSGAGVTQSWLEQQLASLRASRHLRVTITSTVH